MAPTPLIATPQLLELLQGLHAQSTTQESSLKWGTLPAQCSDEFDTLMRDKFIALDQDKCELVYHLLRSINAKTVVEAGTSFGVSTIYLALAVAQNLARDGDGQGRVIATEKEPSKASQAQANWARAGSEIEGVIDLRVGDLRDTLTRDLGVVDFVLLDIWTPLALPALKLVQPHLRRGAIIMTDNTLKAGAGYEDLFAYIDAEGSGFRRITLPYEGGLDMIVYQ
ncbi:S-adenosyl-L-methionine-dependent methyltransferase [Aspergillus sclerotiicarbonarius CBS 121057]|uniref:S-adenosyl-L-methionine-dependent methyltransferase n=1 Tax=Aspergillus sclerotiicarbonarius (strain CBS 121057 / IBT 28362) TaxID=1448318 RepID=A0A319EEQ6_ASPSB|nr:S-adenosyl-L-methionine-dependent methyltransferase [Aspergillus sclerotiicarbonarius CBS 121057]